MPAASPQPITDQLLERLAPSIREGENLLGEFEIFSIIRDAKKISAKDQSLFIQGLAWIIQDDLHQGIKLCEDALTLNPYSGSIWVTYATAVGQKKHHGLQREILKRSVQIKNPSLMIIDFIVASFWVDYNEMKRVKSLYKSFDAIELTEKKKNDYMKAESVYNILSQLSNEDRNQLSQMADFVMKIMFNHSITAKNSSYYVDPDGMLSFSYGVFNESPRFIVELNDELASMIVDNELHNANSIVLFTPGD